jgi:hypothetical protein
MSPRIFGRAADVQPETETAETETAPAEAVPDDLAAAAESLRAEASEALGRAERGNAEARVMIAAADEEAERIKSAARQRALDTQAEATAASRESAALEGRARLITAAIAEQELGGEAVQLGAALEVERVQLGGTIADLDTKLADLGAGRELAGSELAEARTVTDVAGVTAARARLEAIADLEEDLTRQRRQAADRAEAIGDGTGANGEFGAACKAASQHYAKAQDLLNHAYPDSPAAVLARALERLHGTLAGNLQRIREERAGKPQPRQIVHL